MTKQFSTTGDALTDDAASQTAERPVRLLSTVQIVLIATAWIATRPYRGIWLDAQLYMAQALNALDPQRFAGDLYFKFGSQDSFSVFTPFYRLAVAVAGPAGGHLIASVLGQVLWLCALLFLLHTLFRKRALVLLAACATIVLQSKYGNGDFTFGQSSVTPRLFAEPMVLFALAFAHKRQWVRAGLALIASCLLHPLMGLTGVAFVSVFAALIDRRMWIAIGAGAALFAVLALLGIEPFGRALAVFDDWWFQFVWNQSDYLFLTGWRWYHWASAASSVAVILVGRQLAGNDERRFLDSVLVVTIAAALISMIGSELAHNVLMVDVQFWRVNWLTTVVRNAWVAVIVLRLPKDWISREMFILAAIAGVCCSIVIAPHPDYGPLLLLGACIAGAIELRNGAPLTRPLRLIARGAAAVGMTAVAISAWVDIGFKIDWAPTLLRFAIAMAASLLLIRSLRPQRTRLLAAAAPVLLLASLALADARLPWQKYIEAPPADDGLRAFVAGTGSTYWEGEPGRALLWLKLQRPSYYSCWQRASAFFYRDAAIETMRKGPVLQSLNTRDFTLTSCRFDGRVPDLANMGPTRPEQLAAVCRALPDLDTLILNKKLPGVASQAWTAPVPQIYFNGSRDMAAISTFHKYSCAHLR